jgi:hypothetical protein
VSHTRTRPRSVWQVSALLVLCGALAGVSATSSLFSAARGGADDSTRILASAVLLLAAAQLGSGTLVYAGVVWGRYVAIGTCVAAVAGLLTTIAVRLGDGASIGTGTGLLTTFNILLIWALCRHEVRDRC